MAKIDLHSPELYINRELSWLEFNDRVLREGLSADVPPLERLKFLAIVGSNLDEFFMIRVAGLKQQAAAGVGGRDASGLTAVEQLERISLRAHRMVAEQAAGIRDLVTLLARKGLHLLERADLTPDDQAFLAEHFADEVLPVLTPLAVEELTPFPNLPGLALHLAMVLCPPDKDDASARIAVVPVPSGLPRFLALPASEGLRLVRLEDAMAECIGQLFPGQRVLATTPFRLTRDADVTISDDDAADLLEVVEEAVRDRRARAVVRLELAAPADPRLKQWLMNWCEVGDADVYEVDGMLAPSALMEVVAKPGFDALRAPDWPPQPPRDLLSLPSAGAGRPEPGEGRDDLWAAIQNHDVLLVHPYESFEPVVRLVELAASDPDVLAIKQTLYRASATSPIIAALAHAAEKGKQVMVLVELRARFDEERNVTWARRLERAGCHVIYGVAGLKTHAKALLIVRREAHGIRRYVHLATGNYNERTARLYSDIGLITCDRLIAADASAFFNLLTGYSQSVGWNKFAISPTESRQRFIELIEREAHSSTPDQPGLIMAKMNSLEDPRIIRALYRASMAGVRVRLNVRGICCLRPGVKDVSDNIEVVSIVDRFLEHARVFYFRNGGHEEVYLSSADWMRRNLDRRLEIVFPITAPALRRRLISILETYFADNVKAHQLGPDGTYTRPKPSEPRVRAQEKLYFEAVEAVRAATQAPTQFRPLTRPGPSP